MKSDRFIEARGIEYSYPNFLLKPGDFSLNLTDTTFLIGSNGSGKSTLSKLLCGIIRPRSGMVTINGKYTTELSLGEIGKQVGYLWQKPEQQLFAQNVLDELLFVERIKAQNKSVNSEMEEVGKNWLRYFDIEHLAKRSTFFLSRGEKQRLALAAVVSLGTSYLILDEPTTGLDSERKKSLIELLRKLNTEKKIGMLIISHDKEFISTIANRIIVMETGVIVDDKNIN